MGGWRRLYAQPERWEGCSVTLTGVFFSPGGMVCNPSVKWPSSSINWENMDFSTAAGNRVSSDLCQILLSRCSCLQMRNTHTHTHTHKITESCCSISCRPSVRSTVLLKRHDFCFSKMRDATYVFSTVLQSFALEWVENCSVHKKIKIKQNVFTVMHSINFSNV